VNRVHPHRALYFYVIRRGGNSASNTFATALAPRIQSAHAFHPPCPQIPVKELLFYSNDQDFMTV
jgi:hypothetical protein